MTPAAQLQRGFTLVELMVTLAVLAILAAVAVPSFQGTIRLNRVSTCNNSMLAALNLARSEAIKTRGFAEVCASVDGTACGADWSQGWMVWTDTDRDGALTLPADAVLRVERCDAQIVATAGIAGPASVRFNGRGQPVLPAGTVFPANVISLHPAACDSGVEHVRAIQVARTGQVRTARGVCP